MKIPKQFIVIVICLFYAASVSAADSDLLVEFTYKNKQFSIQGKKIDTAYYFNQGADKKIWITTLDWPPYIGQDICRQGWVQQFAVALLVSQGYEVKSTFYPWARTINVAEKGEADILYPEWYIEDSAQSDVIEGTKRRDHLAISERFPGGPIALMKRKGEAVHYSGDFHTLKDEKIAVVRGYQNTPEFDTLMDQGFFSIHNAVDDLMQVKLLWKKRVNLLINDPTAVRFAVTASDLPEKDKQAILDSIEIVKPIVKYNYLYFAVSKKKPGWQATLDMINTTIHEFESTGLLFRIIEDTLAYCKMDMDETFSPYRQTQP